MAPINNDPWNYHGIAGGSYTPNGSNIRRNSLDGPFILNYRGPQLNFTIYGNNQFSSKGNFWTGLWNGLMGVNNYGMKTGFGIFDVGFMFLANKLMNKGQVPSRYPVGTNIDTFNRTNTYIDPAIRNYTPTPKAEDKKTEDKKTEDKKTENQGKDNKTKGTTEPDNNNGKTQKTGAGDNNGNAGGPKKVATTFKAAIIKGAHFDGANMGAKGVNSINGTISSVGSADAKTGLPTTFTVKDTQINRKGNLYTLTLVDVTNDVPRYKVTSATSDGVSIINPEATDDDMTYTFDQLDESGNLVARKNNEKPVTNLKLGNTENK